MWISRLQTWLPSCQAAAITLRFRPGFAPSEPALRQMAEDRGYDIASGTIAIESKGGILQWSFVAIARNRQRMMPISTLSDQIARFEGVTDFHLNYARN